MTKQVFEKLHEGGAIFTYSILAAAFVAFETLKPKTLSTLTG